MGKEMNITLEGVKLDIRKMEQSERYRQDI